MVTSLCNRMHMCVYLCIHVGAVCVCVCLPHYVSYLYCRHGAVYVWLPRYVIERVCVSTSEFM